jgi:recombination protein RecA
MRSCVQVDDLLCAADTGEQALKLPRRSSGAGRSMSSWWTLSQRWCREPEIEGEMGDHMGLQARLMSQALRKLTAISKSQTTVFINQIE